MKRKHWGIIGAAVVGYLIGKFGDWCFSKLKGGERK